MKNKVFLTAVFFLIILGVKSQNNCSTYYPFKAGVEFEITFYDKKGNNSGVANHIVKEIKNNVAIISTSMSDEKGKPLSEIEYNVECTNDGVSVDFKSLVSGDVLSQYKDMDITMTGTNLNIPNSLSTGQQLPDAALNMVIEITPIKMKMFINIVDREVTGKETITTPAGTFDCVVITYKTEMKMGIKTRITSKQWLAEGIGMVKSEDYNKKGKLMSSSELSNLKQ